MAPNIAQKSASEPRARPEASREPFGMHFGFIFASIWALRGLMFELFRGARLLFFGMLLVYYGFFFSCVLFSVARLLSYQATRHRSPKQ